MDKRRQEELLRIARDSIRSAFTGERLDLIPSGEEYGAFVTLRKQGELRGCIGYLEPVCPLEEQIARLARSAAFDDYRFPRLGEQELSLCTVEISLLSHPRPIASVEEFLPGEHGVILTVGSHRSVFLPQVATETGWNREELLGALARKAGLPAEAWKSPEAEFEVFTAEVFSE